MNISNYVREYEELEKEIKLLNEQIKKLRNRKKVCHEFISNYIETNNHPGIKFNNTIIVPKTKKKRVKVNKQEKEQRIDHVFSKYGVDADSRLVAEIIEAMKGDVEEKIDLQIFSK